jgi:hypothetical protein
MKIWIIALTIVFIILKITEKCIANYIRNDKEESMKYYFTGGVTKLGIIYGFVSIIGTLVGASDIVLFIILLLNKL